ncbi:MAG: hypothetical protein KC931_27365, partial [Candidatus Omnitrophica bacterium]|nr:hypothetical protein [Candidatus Omnitrophota bacterium]
MADSAEPGQGSMVSRAVWVNGFSAVLLWLGTWVFFSQAPIDPHFRIDRGEAIAYPMSDALNYYLNGIAFFSGDGWVNWREDTRWSVDKPGWGLFVGSLNSLLGGNTARVQTFLTGLFALVGPAFFFFALSLYRGPRRFPAAFIATVLFLLFAPLEDWGL